MYFVKLQDGAEVAVQLAQTARGRWRATTPDGSHVDLEMRGQDANGQFVVMVNGQQRTFGSVERDGGFALLEGGASHEISVTHAADLVLSSNERVDLERAETETLTSPITGIVLSVPVEPGQTVREGESVVVVEAMKMENSLGAPRSGTVMEVFAKPGQTVFVGDPLVSFK